MLLERIIECLNYEMFVEMGIEKSGAARNAGTKSPLKIFANISKSFVGAGVLGLPYAFKQVQTCAKFIPESDSFYFIF